MNVGSHDLISSTVKFKYVPWTTADTKVCGIPVTYDASKEFQNKKVVLVSVPGAFTPTCSGNHVPRFIENIPELSAYPRTIIF